MKKSLNQRFIDYMNEPFKKRGAWFDFVLYFLISFLGWTFYWFICLYFGFMMIAAVFLIPLQLIVGFFK